MSKSDIEAGRAHVAFYVKNSAFLKGLQAMQQRMSGFGQSLSKIGSSVSSMGKSILNPLTDAITKFAERGSMFAKVSAQTGNSVESISKLAGAAGAIGIEIDDVVGSMEELNIRLGEAVQDGTGPLADTFKKLGIDAKEFSKLSVTDQYEKLADVLSGIEDRAERQFMADEIFGGDAFKIMPLLEKGGAALAEQLGQVSAMSTKEAKSAQMLTTLWNQLNATFNNAVTAIGGALAPAMIEVLTIVKKITSPVVEWIKANQKLIQIIAAVGVGLVVVGSAITALGIAFIGAGAAIGGVISVVGAIATAIGVLLSPMGLLTAAVVGGIAYWALWSKSGRETVAAVLDAFAPMVETIKDTVGGVYDAIAGGDLALAGKIAITGLKLVVAEGLAGLASLVDGLWGNTIKAIGGDLLKGDFVGAWNTALAAMGAAWDAWSSAVVKTFAGIAKAIVGMWEGTVNRISNFLLEQAASDGVTGKLFSGLLGVDVNAEAAKSEQFERQTRERRQRQLPEMIQRVEGELAAARAGGDDRQVSVLEKQIARLKAELATENGLGDFDPLAAGRDAISQQTGGTADAMRSFFDGLAEQADAAAAESAKGLAGATSGGAGRFDDLLSSLRDDLAQLNNEAAAKRAAAALGADKDPGKDKKQDDQAVSLADKVAVSFSAAALSALGQGGGGPQERIAKAAEKQLAKQEELRLLNEAMLQELRNGGPRFA